MSHREPFSFRSDMFAQIDDDEPICGRGERERPEQIVEPYIGTIDVPENERGGWLAPFDARVSGWLKERGLIDAWPHRNYEHDLHN